MTFDPWPITGVLSFDYFFTLGIYFGLIAVVPAALFRLFRW